MSDPSPASCHEHGFVEFQNPGSSLFHVARELRTAMDRQPLLTRLLREYLRPRLREVSLVATLLLVQSIATLYLPNLNADIINNGVLKGDIGYIWQAGGLMLATTLAISGISIVAVYFS